ncbi:hypothetical protein PsYK624_065450 [Phanerochaete sordida]|uniref:Uncharacterized protein n=1 Tax=Phanerochaete sordida TaxID=48140 RepID=A0A9P3G8T8_9APHY|nr:hypothetical protein PsYK624_065450 [Phanerochaete sordida]
MSVERARSIPQPQLQDPYALERMISLVAYMILIPRLYPGIGARVRHPMERAFSLTLCSRLSAGPQTRQINVPWYAAFTVAATPRTAELGTLRP